MSLQIFQTEVLYRNGILQPSFRTANSLAEIRKKERKKRKRKKADKMDVGGLRKVGKKLA
jgi:hypothetical protein